MFQHYPAHEALQEARIEFPSMVGVDHVELEALIKYPPGRT